MARISLGAHLALANAIRAEGDFTIVVEESTERDGCVSMLGARG